MSWQNLRIGIGHDTHRLERGGPLLIGGVSIDHDMQLVGHSDADVLLHAVTDAILGAAALGDIGELFPNDSEENRNRDSTQMLAIARDRVSQAGYSIVNVDCIVFAQQPKLTPYKAAIRDHIATALQIEIDCVGVKAKTGEGVDAVGENRAIQTQCVALLART